MPSIGSCQSEHADAGAALNSYSIAISGIMWRITQINQLGGVLATIIIVDDEVPIRQSLRRFLEMHDHAVLEARDGSEALKMLGRHEIDLAFVDLMMPRMSGLELMNRIRREHPDLKVVVVSAYDEILDLAEREKDIVMCLKKPFQLDEVAEALELALGDDRRT